MEMTHDVVREELEGFARGVLRQELQSLTERLRRDLCADLERIVKTEGLSENVYEIVSKSLE